jgi:hypothetical protein
LAFDAQEAIGPIGVGGLLKERSELRGGDGAGLAVALQMADGVLEGENFVADEPAGGGEGADGVSDGDGLGGA